MNKPLVFGIVAGAFVLLAIFAFLIYYYCCKKTKRKVKLHSQFSINDMPSGKSPDSSKNLSSDKQINIVILQDIENEDLTLDRDNSRDIVAKRIKIA